MAEDALQTRMAAVASTALAEIEDHHDEDREDHGECDIEDDHGSKSQSTILLLSGALTIVDSDHLSVDIGSNSGGLDGIVAILGVQEDSARDLLGSVVRSASSLPSSRQSVDLIEAASSSNISRQISSGTTNTISSIRRVRANINILIHRKIVNSAPGSSRSTQEFTLKDSSFL